jgi:serine/threonine protein kinase
MSSLIGQTIGVYQIEALLGSGGMGQVFQARHTLLGRPVAIKLLHDVLAANSTFQTRFRQEARAIAGLRHPHIVEIYDFDQFEGRAYLAMELITGGSLRTFLDQQAKQTGGWQLDEVLRLLRQAADGLHYAHQLGLVHRDIKPENLLLKHDDDRFVLKIADFGLARFNEEVSLTASGMAMGTPAYMSPEQCRGQELDGRSDLYALGVILYEVATGSLPFPVKSIADAVHKHVFEMPPAPRTIRPELPAALEQIILDCLAKHRDERYKTGLELQQALDRLLAQSGLACSIPITPRRLTEPTLRSGLVVPPTVKTAGIATTLTVFNKQGETVRQVPVSKGNLKIGRAPGNELVLDHHEVSRNHAHLNWNGQQATITDLGSSNGTHLHKVRLTPQVEQSWAVGTPLRIGPFWLRIDLVQAAETEPAALFKLTPEVQEIKLVPGQTSHLRLTVENLSPMPDHLTFLVKGVPEHWIVRGFGSVVQIEPAQQLPVELQILVPRSAEALAQKYDVTVFARSRRRPNEGVQTIMRWDVQEFRELQFELTPTRVAGRNATYRAAIINSGNCNETCRVQAEDEDDRLELVLSQEQCTIAAGRSEVVRVRVEHPLRPIGDPQAYRLQVRLLRLSNEQSRGEVIATRQAQFIHQAWLPIWSVPTGILLLLVLCSFLLAWMPAAVVGWIPGYGLLAQPTPTETPAVEATIVVPTMQLPPTITPLPTPTLQIPATLPPEIQTATPANAQTTLALLLPTATPGEIATVPTALRPDIATATPNTAPTATAPAVSSPINTPITATTPVAVNGTQTAVVAALLSTAPTLTSPVEGATLEQIPRTLTLVWETVPGATNYQIEVEYCDPSCDVLAIAYLAVNVSGTSYTFDFVDAKPGRWRVRAATEAGLVGPFSGWRTFRFMR